MTQAQAHPHHYRLPDQQVVTSTRRVYNALAGATVTIKRAVVKNSNRGECIICKVTRTFHPRYQWLEEEPLEEHLSS